MTTGEFEEETSRRSFINPRNIALFIIFSMIVFALVGVYGDPDDVIQAIVSIPWYWVIPVMMMFSFLNYIYEESVYI